MGKVVQTEGYTSAEALRRKETGMILETERWPWPKWWKLRE